MQLSFWTEAESSNNNVGVQQGKETEDGQSNGISGTQLDKLGTSNTQTGNILEHRHLIKHSNPVINETWTTAAAD